MRIRGRERDNGSRSPIELLQLMLGKGSEFRPGQLEAIQIATEERGRALVVQRTGWGKSIVYFIATAILRERGAGPTVLISPLLSLMRDQERMASRIGIRARRIASDQQATERRETERLLEADEVDVLFISPERLSDSRFQTTTLAAISGGIGMFVVDEAHCISDWGHDFRPDYRRIIRILQTLPGSVPVLATTATANDRVVRDVVDQLGSDIQVLRGPLARESLRLQVIEVPDTARRLALLAKYVDALPGSGIVYCSTVGTTEHVAEWLRASGVSAHAYHGRLESAQRHKLEDELLRNDVKTLVATVALGMGFDKPDLGFVVHFEAPGSLVAYYQQIGRAGRAIDDAVAFLLHGPGDAAVQEWFIESAFPAEADMRAVLAVVEANDACRIEEVEADVNLSRGAVKQILKLLEIDGAIELVGQSWVRTVRPWNPDHKRIATVRAQRTRELEHMNQYVRADRCFMQHVLRELDDSEAAPCGKCANCTDPIFSPEVDRTEVNRAVSFLRERVIVIQPRKKKPQSLAMNGGVWIASAVRIEEGRALCEYGDSGWGEAVATGKYHDDRFSDELVQAAARLILERWRPYPFPEWIVPVPSLRRPELVADFATRLASALAVPVRYALEKALDTPEQKTMLNGTQQATNVARSFRVAAQLVLSGPVLLVDDVVDSRWTMTACGAHLRRAGSGPVHPFALARASRNGGS